MQLAIKFSKLLVLIKNIRMRTYQAVLEGKGFELKESRQSLEIVHSIIKRTQISLKGDYHPFAKFFLTKQPFKR